MAVEVVEKTEYQINSGDLLLTVRFWNDGGVEFVELDDECGNVFSMTLDQITALHDLVSKRTPATKKGKGK